MAGSSAFNYHTSYNNVSIIPSGGNYLIFANVSITYTAGTQKIRDLFLITNVFCCFFLLAPILVLRFFRWEHSCHHMKELLLNSDAASKNKSSILLILLFIQL